MKTRLLFINAIDTAQSIETSNPPLGLAYLAASLRKQLGAEAVEIRIVDSGVERELLDFRPDIVGISAVTQNYGRAIACASLVKKHGLPVLCGGVHISMLPASFSPQMDVGVIGEGELTICALVSLFREKNGFPAEELKKINGIIYWEQGRLAATERRAPAEPLDSLPLPARDLLAMTKSAAMFTSRGCLYRCAFCASSRFWGRIRLFSAGYVVNEIAELREKYGAESINFLDDLFSADVGRVREIKDLLKKRGLLGKLKFTCSIRANKVDDEMAGLFRELGVESVGMGLESGCEESLDYLKGGVTLAENYKAVETIRKSGMRVYGSFVIGSPEESGEGILKTLEFIKKSRVDAFGVYVLTPFPGTPVWAYAEAKGLVGAEMDWETLSVNFKDNHARVVILSEKLTRDELYGLWLRFERLKFRKYLAYLLGRGVRAPWKIPGFLLEKLLPLRRRK